MADFQSQVYPGEPINMRDVRAGNYGLVRRDFNTHPIGYSAAAPEFNDADLIPQNEWDDRIRELEVSQTRLSDYILSRDVQFLDQDGLPYCWIFACGNAMKALRAKEGQPEIDFSPTACGALITNYRKVGGWGLQGVEFIAESGMPTSKHWPHWQLSSKYDTPDMRANAKMHQVVKWKDHGARRLDRLMTSLFKRRPCPVGYNEYGHEMCAIDPVKVNGEYGVRVWNSWKGWGFHGMGLLLGRHAIPDDSQSLESLEVSGV